MTFRLRRLESTPVGTFGSLSLPAGKPLWTLEPVQPVIPAGRYSLELNVSARAVAGKLWSPLPSHMLPEVKDVPGHTGIRIHAGNAVEDTSGCILVGREMADHRLAQSRIALTTVTGLMLASMGENGAIVLEIENATR